MSLLKITKRFENLDTAYTELYENEIEFEKHMTQKTREDVLKSIQKLRQQLNAYNHAVSNLYIRGDWIGFKID